MPSGVPPVQVAMAPWVDDSGAAHAVALEILLHGPIARSEIARRLHLSAGSLTRITKPLIEDGLIAEVEHADRDRERAGRPVQPLDVVSSARSFVGMKITAETVTGVLTDLRANVIGEAVVALKSPDPADVTATVRSVLKRLDRPGHPISGLGIGLGGLVSDHDTVVSAPFLDWNMVPFGRMVEDAAGVPTTIDNDLIALTAYENWFGAGRGKSCFAVLTLGAGIGYGLVVHGELVIDTDSGLGLVGHWPLDPFGPICPAGSSWLRPQHAHHLSDHQRRQRHSRAPGRLRHSARSDRI